jgi:hypothetical protein
VRCYHSTIVWRARCSIVALIMHERRCSYPDYEILQLPSTTRQEKTRRWGHSQRIHYLCDYWGCHRDLPGGLSVVAVIVGRAAVTNRKQAERPGMQAAWSPSTFHPVFRCEGRFCLDCTIAKLRAGSYCPAETRMNDSRGSQERTNERAMHALEGE